MDGKVLETRRKVPPDSGFAWIILLAATVFHVCFYNSELSLKKQSKSIDCHLCGLSYFS